jgi:hypothetical protein
MRCSPDVENSPQSIHLSARLHPEGRHMRTAVIGTAVLVCTLGTATRAPASSSVSRADGVDGIAEGAPALTQESATDEVSTKPEADSRSSSAVRSTEPLIVLLIADACQRSASFRQLVTDIADSGGIVYIKSGRCPVGGMNGCLLHLLHEAGDLRYLWIHVRTTRTSRVELMATLAHELQHATEILSQPHIRRGSDIRRFYSSPGAKEFGARRSEASSRSYETTAALKVGNTVRAELLATDATDATDGQFGCDPSPALRDDAVRRAR